MDRLSVPPAVNQFSHSMTKDKATALFKLLAKYRPEAPADKKARLLAAAEATAAGKDVESKGPACAIKFGLKHVTALVEEKKAKLVIIASDVDPIELVVWLPALCRKMNVPYCIVKNKSRLGALVYQKNATALCLTSVNKADESELRNLEEVRSRVGCSVGSGHAERARARRASARHSPDLPTTRPSPLPQRSSTATLDSRRSP